MRNARGQALLSNIDKKFDFRPDTLRPFGWRRIDFPKGDHRRPPAFVIRRFEEKFLESPIFVGALGGSWGHLEEVSGPPRRLLKPLG